MRKIDVCLSPELLHLYEVKDKIVVVVDILRATSCMTTAIAYGVKSITPVASLEACMKLKNAGCVAAAEREGKKAKGFDLGNSPFNYMDPNLVGKKIAVTTTNGTLAIEKSKDAMQLVIGAFLNLSAVSSFLKSQDHDVLIVCAGWKGKVNLEDTLYAGALIEQLNPELKTACDAPIAALHLYKIAKSDLTGFLAGSSHVKRLHRLKIQKDIEFCLEIDKYNVVPVFREGKIVKLETGIAVPESKHSTF